MDKINSLTPAVRHILCDKATEYPHTGIYNIIHHGSYLCRRCGLALFRGSSQFSSGCGWPSFDAEIKNGPKMIPDADGKRMEVLCGRCDSHLGHVFDGEHFTKKNRRFCINSLSLDFVKDLTILDSEEAIVAGGCFWGLEYYLSREPGILKTEVGYIGGHIAEPTYETVCQGQSGHFEALRLVYDPLKIDYSTVLKLFFATHDPTQADGQGPDIGQQYQSAIFYYDDEQKKMAESIMAEFRQKGANIATKLLEMQVFWSAEAYHQRYYDKNGKLPYCHRRPSL